MQKCLCFADVTLRIVSERPFYISRVLERFTGDENKATTELQLLYTELPLQRKVPPCVEEDFFRRFCAEGESVCVEMKGAEGKPSAALFCSGKTLRYEIYHDCGKSITGWLSLLPMPWLLYSEGVLFLHASRVALDGSAILFVGPSGVGKSTQAALWQKYGGGEILSNDRVLLRRLGAKWQTYGYFEDGDTPVCSPKRAPLGAIVLLSQAEQNNVSRATPSKALAQLMGQTLIEHWDAQMKQAVLAALLELVQEIPVYALQCRADAEAVGCLAQRLRTDGVILWR